MSYNAVILDEFQAAQYIAKNDVTFVSGSFDLLHYGHMHFLDKAKNAAPNNKLLICLLPDDQIKRRKGENRPIFSQEIRAKALLMLKCVDEVLLWSQEWEKLREFVVFTAPKTLAVVSGDPGLINKQRVITEAGCKLIIIDKFADFSTSAILRAL